MDAWTISQGEVGKKDTKNIYICININSRVTELYHTLLRWPGAPGKKQNTKWSGYTRSKSVKDCQSAFSNVSNHPGDATRTHYKAINTPKKQEPSVLIHATQSWRFAEVLRKLEQLEVDVEEWQSIWGVVSHHQHQRPSRKWTYTVVEGPESAGARSSILPTSKQTPATRWEESFRSGCSLYNTRHIYRKTISI